MTLTASGVSHGFDGDAVLGDVSLRVEPGEVVTIVGPSGTGKTTLLRLLAAFQPPDTGTVSWDGTDLWAVSEHRRLAIRRRMSMVFQEPSLFNAPVHRNVLFGNRVRLSWPERLRLRVRGVLGDDSAMEAVRETLETVGMTEKADQNALSLSGGEAQRVAFARALAVDPEIVLLDEPTSNLDPRNTGVLEAAIREACADGVGAVVATHDMHQAKRLSDRVVFLLDGEIVETGAAERIFERPEDPRTKRFIEGELLYEPDDENTQASGDPSE